jgi:hypothetical protein
MNGDIDSGLITELMKKLIRNKNHKCPMFTGEFLIDGYLLAIPPEGGPVPKRLVLQHFSYLMVI